MKYRWSRWWAHVVATLGVVVIGLGLGLAGLALMTDLGSFGLTDARRVALAAACLSAGLLLGGSIITTGQVLGAFLDQRRLLHRIHRRLATWERERREEADVRAVRERGRSGRAG
jgi:hypothetical protein